MLQTGSKQSLGIVLVISWLLISANAQTSAPSAKTDMPTYSPSQATTAASTTPSSEYTNSTAQPTPTISFASTSGATESYNQTIQFPTAAPGNDTSSPTVLSSSSSSIASSPDYSNGNYSQTSRPSLFSTSKVTTPPSATTTSGGGEPSSLFPTLAPTLFESGSPSSSIPLSSTFPTSLRNTALESGQSLSPTSAALSSSSSPSLGSSSAFIDGSLSSSPPTLAQINIGTSSPTEVSSINELTTSRPSLSSIAGTNDPTSSPTSLSSITVTNSTSVPQVPTTPSPTLPLGTTPQPTREPSIGGVQEDNFHMGYYHQKTSHENKMPPLVYDKIEAEYTEPFDVEGEERMISPHLASVSQAAENDELNLARLYTGGDTVERSSPSHLFGGVRLRMENGSKERMWNMFVLIGLVGICWMLF